MAGSTPSFVGRERELQTLRGMFGRSTAGEGGIALLAGEPGIGKTSLCDEFAREAANGGATVLWGRCWEGEGAPPFWPWIQLIRAYTRGVPDAETLRAEMGAGAADIAAIVPEVRERLPGLEPPPAVDLEQARFRLFDSVAAFLRNAAAERPLLAILEDLHWADTPSLLLLQFLAAEIGQSQLLLLGTYRDMEVTRSHPLTGVLAALARHGNVSRMTVKGLSESEVSDLVEAVAGERPAPDALALLYGSTEGNPLFVKEFVRLQRTGQPGLEVGGLPDTVREVLSRRLASLSPATTRALSLGAVLGREFSLAVLEAMGELPALELLAALEEAEAARLVAASDATAGRYTFTHALVRETLYEELTSAGRIRLHKQAGEAIERLYAQDLERHLAELAHHFGAAAAAGEAEKAFEYCRRAGEQAVALTAHEAAAAYYMQALQAIDQTGRAGPEERGRLFLEAGKALRRAGALREATDTLGQAADIARRARLPGLLAETAIAWVGDSGEPVDWSVYDISSEAQKTEVALALLHDALELLPEEDATTRIRLLGVLAYFLQVIARDDECKAADREARQLVDRVTDPAALARALNTEYFVADPDVDVPLEEQFARIQRLKRLAREGNEFGLVAEALEEQLNCAIRLGWIEQARAGVEEMVQLSRLLRVPVQYARACYHQEGLARLEGRFEDASRLVGEGRRLAEHSGSPLFRWQGTIHVSELYRDQGRLGERLDHFLRQRRHEANTMFDPRSDDPARYWWSFMPLAYFEAGLLDEAHADFECFARHRFQDATRIGVIWFPSMAYLAEACVRLGRREDAQPLYELLLPHADSNIASYTWCGCEGSVSYLLGMLAGLLGWRDAATAFFEAGLEMHARLQSPPLIARAQLDYAAMLGTSDMEEWRKATGLAAQALETFRELGVPAWEARALELQSRLASAPPGREPAPAYPDGLTGREVEVLRLIADGRSNAEIAEALVLSVKTIERHISNIYGKINARGRADATAYTLRHDL
jgi:DNA-binding CsgD family transcriptional regulator